MEKRCAKATRDGNLHSNRMPAYEDRSPIDTPEIKREPDIEVEPQPPGNSTTSADELSFPDDNRSENHDDDEVCSDDDDNVKIEVKDEFDENEKKEMEDGSEPTVADDNGMNRNSLVSNENGSNAHNGKEPITSKAKKRKASKQYHCSHCEYSTTHKPNLRRHFLKHTGKKPFACKRCSKAFTSNRSLQFHLKVHVKDFLFSCAVCLKGFNQKSVKAKHEDNCEALRYECHLCQRTFGTKRSDLLKHMGVHSGQRAFECIECHKQFAQKQHLQTHMELHTGHRPFRCSKCRRAFARQNDKMEHEQKCNRRTYQCYVCGKSFGLKKSNLFDHMRTHTGVKPFGCTKCTTKFALKGDLTKHLKIHSRSFAWKCAICRKGFFKPAQCQMHQRSCRRRGYECHLCKQFFASNKAQLNRHMTRHSGDKPFQCEICRNRFTRKENLKKHFGNMHNKKNY